MFRMYKRVFVIEGFEVDLAFDGQEGLDKANLVKPDIILLDVMMPKLNGLQTLEKLKSDTSLKDIIVVMLTNLANKTDAESAIHLGAAKYLIKSDADPQDVVKTIRELLPTSP